jgi:hypothetical protein
MISEAAYFRALTRGFQGGSPMDDWLAAELEISRLLPSPTQQKKEQAAYERLRAEVQKLLADAKDSLSADTIRHALEQARAQMRLAGDYTVDTLDKAMAGIEKEMLGAAHRVGARLENLSERGADVFSIWRDRSAQFLAHAATAVGDWVREAGERVGRLEYRTGDIASAGTLECTACGQRVELDTPAHVPVCPQCRKTVFRRVP